MYLLTKISVLASAIPFLLLLGVGMLGSRAHAQTGIPAVGNTTVSLPNGGTEIYFWTAASPGFYRFDYWGNINNHGSLFVRVSRVENGVVTLLHSWAGAANFGDLHEQMFVGHSGETFLVEFTDWGAGGFGSISGECASNSTDVYEPNDTCLMAAPISSGLVSASVTTGSVDFYELQVPAGHTVTVDIPNGENMYYLNLQLVAASDPALCSGMGSNAPLSQGAPLLWTNGGSSTETVFLFVAIDPVSDLGCAEYDATVLIAPTAISKFCDPMDPHSGGFPAQLNGSLGSGFGSGLQLESNGGPPNQFGYFLVGTGLSEPGIPFGSGRLCLSVQTGEAIGRYNVGSGALQSLGRFDVFGVFQNLSGTANSGTGFDVPTDLPNGGGTISAGETWHFQMWFRDQNGGAGSTGFTNGLSVRF